MQTLLSPWQLIIVLQGMPWGSFGEEGVGGALAVAHENAVMNHQPEEERHSLQNNEADGWKGQFAPGLWAFARPAHKSLQRDEHMSRASSVLRPVPC